MVQVMIKGFGELITDTLVLLTRDLMVVMLMVHQLMEIIS